MIIKPSPIPSGLPLLPEEEGGADLESYKKSESPEAIVLAHLAQGFLLLDGQFQVQWANEAFRQMADTAVPGQPLAALWQELGAASAELEKLQQQLEAGKPVSEEVQVLGNHWWALEIVPVPNANGPVEQYALSAKDITSKKKEELDLVKLTEDLYRQTRDLQQFTYIVSHNLRGPVANALGLSNLLSRLKKEDAGFDPLVSQVKSSVFQLDTIIKDINLILSIKDNQDTVEKEPVRLADVCQQVISSLQESLQNCGGTVQVQIPQNYTLAAKKAYLYSIVYNLLSNAIKYRSKERPLEVSIFCEAAASGGTIIQFADNGSGMDLNKVRDDVFTLYKRFHRNIEGRGIGLFLVKTHVESLGGHIEIDSALNVGTTFTLHLD
ncbi:PAS domain-containing protein [Nibribacter ruber]|uniref:histidine kinase n=1 Tax=Nibribacter ruber TaxID=2698458 RepID=A0A6P1NYW6_9BACT|nr:PAS domain-containing sensor histidine kinase [Nibribacter ruber]QHL87168.1 PAS domain-containing protein [Nibribacter ruber]